MIIKSDLTNKYRANLKYDFLPKKTIDDRISFLNYRLAIELKVNLEECSNGDVKGIRWVAVDEFILGNDWEHIEELAGNLFNSWLSLKGYDKYKENKFITKRFLDVK